MNNNRAVKLLELDCPKHGVYIAFATSLGLTRCPSCAFLGDESRHVAHQFSEDTGDRDAEHEDRLRSSGIPGRFLGCRFGNYWPNCSESGEVLRHMEVYVSTFEAARADASNLILLGGAGTGKTHLAVASLSNFLKKGLRVRYADARKRIGFGVESRPPDVLVIDNVGANRSSNQMEAIRNLLMDRYDLMLPSILVSGLGRSSLEALLGEAVLDRLREGNSKIISFRWESYRRATQQSQ